MGRYDSLHGDEDEIEFEFSHKKMMKDFMTADDRRDAYVVSHNLKENSDEKPGE